MLVPPQTRTLVVYCFSGMQEVMENAIVPDFQQRWRQKTGEQLDVITTFAGSGAITSKVIAAFPAEVAILSSELDSARLRSAGVATRPDRGTSSKSTVISRTPLVIVTRPGNPEGIEGFSDLARPETRTIFPDPSTSGAGQWGVLAVYEASRRKRDVDPMEVASRVLRNAAQRPASAALAFRAFKAGLGDTLVTYESSVLSNPSREQLAGEMVYPEQTILCEPVVVAIERNIDPDQSDLVDTFMSHLQSREAQRNFVAYGFRSVTAFPGSERGDFGDVRKFVTLDSLGKRWKVRRLADRLASEYRM